MFQLFTTPKFDFMGWRRAGVIGSCVLIALSVATLIYHQVNTGDPLNYGIDFRGGSLFQVRFAQPPVVSELRASLEKEGLSSAVLQRFAAPEDDTVLIRVPEDLEASDDLVSRVHRALRSPAELASEDEGKLDINSIGESDLAAMLEMAVTGEQARSRGPRFMAAARSIIEVRNSQERGTLSEIDALRDVDGVSEEMYQVLADRTFVGSLLFERTESVGPTVGKTLRNKAMFASLVANGLILLYLSMRFELRYGVAAVITLLHDVIVVLGAFALTNREVDLPVLAAILTVIGYSVNDTIVVFDRIRMNLRTMRKGSLAEVINASINQTLSRTALTTGSTLLVLIPLYLFGGVVLQGFAFALLLGIVVGTYSSIFISSPILIVWQRLLSDRA